MREIKFRVWPGNGEPMWYGKTSEMFKMIEAGYPFEVMQYTGLKDKNGVEVYEGDIVKHHWNTNVIKWDDNMGMFACGSYGRFGEAINYQGIKCEVIGNIYENPELLK